MVNRLLSRTPPPPSGEKTRVKGIHSLFTIHHSRVSAVASLFLFLCLATAQAAELRIGLSADVTTMDPHFIAAQPNLTAQHHVFDTLVPTDVHSRPTPGVATWRTPDPLTWEFTLRKGVKFHDGSELTTEDVAYSLERPNT